MSIVWILSEGEDFEGDSVVAVYAKQGDAMRALEAIANIANSKVRTDGDFSIVQDEGCPYYTVLRPEVIL
jgi:hypothetical protein